MSDDEPLPMRLVRHLVEAQVIPEKTLVIVVTMGADGVVKTGSSSPIPAERDVLRAALLEAFLLLGDPEATHMRDKIEIGKA